MANEWGETQLSRIAKLRSGFPFKSSSWVEDGVPVIKIANVKDGRIVADGCGYVSHETAATAREWMTQKGDVLIAMTGYVGEVARVRSGEKYLINQRVGRFDFLDDSPVIPEFFFYYLRQPEVRSLLETMARGSAQPNLSASDAAKLWVPVPPPAEQRAIAHILGKLDEKIELNRKQNKTLEAMARTLFKAWFVDFEPVRAKIEGRWQRGESLPGLPARLYDHFPDQLVDSDSGEMPKGWEITSLSEFSSLNPESWTKRTRPEQIRYVDLSNTKWGRVECVTHYEANDAPSRAQRVLRPLDTLVGTVRPGNGSYALISDEGLTGSSGFAVLRPLAREYSALVYLAATSRENIERLSNLADGGAYPAVRPEIVSATQVLRSGQELINEFSQQVSPMLAGMADNERISQSLTQLRDTLLPKLISGELRVSDAERIVGA